MLTLSKLNVPKTALQRVTTCQKQRRRSQRPVAGNRKKEKNRRDLRRKCRCSQRLLIRPKYPLGESNPCLRTENPMSWATRRRGR